MKIPDYEVRLDALFDSAFRANDPAMLDWVSVKFELKNLRRLSGHPTSIKSILFAICVCIGTYLTLFILGYLFGLGLKAVIN